MRWLGDRKGIEEVTKTWDKTVVDRREDLTNWVELFRKFVARNLKAFAYSEITTTPDMGQQRQNSFGTCGKRNNRIVKAQGIYPNRH